LDWDLDDAVNLKHLSVEWKTSNVRSIDIASLGSMLLTPTISSLSVWIALEQRYHYDDLLPLAKQLAGLPYDTNINMRCFPEGPRPLNIHSLGMFLSTLTEIFRNVGVQVNWGSMDSRPGHIWCEDCIHGYLEEDETDTESQTEARDDSDDGF
jgi:hypothetical protein